MTQMSLRSLIITAGIFAAVQEGINDPLSGGKADKGSARQEVDCPFASPSPSQ
jgi:hypothetical protein